MKTKDPLVADILFNLESKKDAVSTRLLSGKCQNIEDYRKLTGILEGIDFAIGVIEHCVTSYLSEDHDEN
jgi:hypothetical protein